MALSAAAVSPFSRHGSLAYICPHRRYRSIFLCVRSPSRMSFVALLFLLLYVGQGLCANVNVDAPIAEVSSVIVEKAYIHYCDDVSLAEEPKCVRQLTVDLTLDDGLLGAPILEGEVTLTQALHRSLFPRLAGSDTAYTDATSLQVSFPPISVSVQHSAIQTRYELTYLRTFPATLREEILRTYTALTCVDEFTHCPSYTSVNGTLVSAPLGVCCLCTSIMCAVDNPQCNEPMRTHFCLNSIPAGMICLHEEGARYRGWSVGDASNHYSLRLSASGKGIENTTLTSKSNEPQARQGASFLELRNSLGAPFGEVNVSTNVTGRVLFIPYLEGSDDANPTSYRLSSDPTDWLLLPEALVSISGKDCNKVGLSQEYFYSLPQFAQCVAPKGKCLENQLADYRSKDLDRVSHGVGGRYLAVSLGMFELQVKGSKELLVDVVQRTSGAVARWVVDADQLPWKALPVHGVLDAAQHVNDSGSLSVTIRNNNTYAGFYCVAIGQCQGTQTSECDSVGPSGDCLRKVLVAGANTSSVVGFTMTNTFRAGIGRIASCIVFLRDTDGVTLAYRNVSWNIGYDVTTSPPTVSKANGCKDCAFNDLGCLLRTVCEWQLLVWTVVFVAVIWMPYILLAYWRIVWVFITHHIARRW